MSQYEAGEFFIRNVNRRIAEVRTEKGLSQAEVAEKLNVALRSLQYWESEKNMTLWTIYKLTVALQCEAAEFFQEPKAQKKIDGRSKKSN